MSHETIIDIGGGEGEFLTELARQNPQNYYLVIEPSKDIYRVPQLPNLGKIIWKTEEDSVLPLKPSSVDVAHLHFMLAEVGDTNDDMTPYAHLLMEIRTVLKPNGKVSIIEPSGNIEIIGDLLDVTGYRAMGKPQKIKNPITKWTRQFLNVMESFDNSNIYQPTQIEARMIPLKQN